MLLNSVREVKAHFLENAMNTFNVGVATPQRRFPRSMALGVSQGSDGKSVLAVRCFGKRQGKLHKAFIDLLFGKVHNEMDVQYVNPVSAIDPMMSDEKMETQNRVRPVKVGYSIGHKNITAGSVGAVAMHNGILCLVSNAHVLNDCNNGRKGDAVYQPGKYDRGTEADTVARVLKSIKLKKDGNVVDAAIAQVVKGVECDPFDLGELGKWNGFSTDDLEVGMEIKKRGRTTNFTYGKISAYEVDNLVVNYGEMGALSFNGQIECITEDGSPWILPGDSGSVAQNTDNRSVGLNFAGNNVQGYANDMREVVKALKLKMVK